MKDSVALVCLVCFIGCALAGHGRRQAGGLKWNQLSIRWPSYHEMPLFLEDAKEWKELSDDCQSNGPFVGRRFARMKDGDFDRGLILIFDHLGQVSGVQIAFPKSYQVPKSFQSMFIESGSFLYLTAYFIEPTKMCSNGRKRASIGDGLRIQLTPQNLGKPLTYMAAPLTEEKTTGTGWVKGKCFYSMGQHYWYKISTDMSSEDFFPVFLLYNKGKLNGWGWATLGDLKNDLVEHPSSSVLTYFFQPESHPKCLDTESTKRGITTQHVYLQSWPKWNFC